MLPALASLIALQQLDTAAETARRRLTELPAALQAIESRIADATQGLDEARQALNGNQQSRRDLEKQVASVDSRLARFDEHKAAVKTNQEYTALLHEIETARREKDGLEEQILVLLEEADTLQARVRDAETAVADARGQGDADRAALAAERTALEAEVTRLEQQKKRDAVDVPAAVLARYEQLLKQRKMLAVAELHGEICAACHVRLRPAISQQIRRNADIVACESCQRILYAPPPAPAADQAAP